jgi:hypothetical protein
MSKQPIFVLGVGAQKAGTTWLHSYLEQSSLTNMGLLKEYHIWDAVFLKAYNYYKISDAEKKQGKKKNLRFRMQNHENAYVKYFSRLVSENTPLTGDISPSYNALTAESLSFIKLKMEAAGFRVKLVFLMRDPVKRCWSAARMVMGRGENRGSDVFTQETATAFLRPILKGKRHSAVRITQAPSKMLKAYLPLKIRILGFSKTCSPPTVSGTCRIF